MNNKILSILIFVIFLMGISSGFIIFDVIETLMMGDYELYNCIYNNANSNNFAQNPIMIQKIQDECICFREHNFTNLSEVNCST